MGHDAGRLGTRAPGYQLHPWNTTELKGTAAVQSVKVKRLVLGGGVKRTNR